jgi:hypothetical protein
MAKIRYDIDMAMAVRRIKKPVRGLVMDIRGLPEFLCVSVYEENIMEYSDSQREAIMEYLIMVREVIRSYGVPCEIQGFKYNEDRRF